jgi:hypothetical protein
MQIHFLAPKNHALNQYLTTSTLFKVSKFYENICLIFIYKMPEQLIKCLHFPHAKTFFLSSFTRLLLC